MIARLRVTRLLGLARVGCEAPLSAAPGRRLRRLVVLHLFGRVRAAAFPSRPYACLIPDWPPFSEP
jgi:hypothetical protein